MKKAAKANGERAVVVTTAHRGVFFGYASDVAGEIVTLKKARLCLYWSEDVRASWVWPQRGRAGVAVSVPAVESMDLRSITAIIACSPQATEAWEKQPWA
jgi:hypothetical protein